MFWAKTRSCRGSVKVENVSTSFTFTINFIYFTCHLRAISEYSYTFTFPPPVPELSSEPTAIIGLQDYPIRTEPFLRCKISYLWSLDKEGFQEMQEQGSFTCISSLGIFGFLDNIMIGVLEYEALSYNVNGHWTV